MPSIYEIQKSKLRGAVKTYNNIKTTLDKTPEDDRTDEMYDRERLYRGIVRGMAMMLCGWNPQFANDKDMVTQMEVRYGVVGSKSNRPPAPVSPQFLTEPD